MNWVLSVSLKYCNPKNMHSYDKKHIAIIKLVMPKMHNLHLSDKSKYFQFSGFLMARCLLFQRKNQILVGYVWPYDFSAVLLRSSAL